MNDPWIALRRFTQARIALGRAGHAVPTGALLDFQLAHARARDAVHFPWDVGAFAAEVRGLGGRPVVLGTPVSDRGEYLRRPDLGRVLADDSRAILEKDCAGEDIDVALIVTNGLSSTAVERHGIPLLRAILARYRQRNFRVGPIGLVENGRVALADDIGATLSARLAVIVVGERPGLSAADSLGIYLTYAPRIGNTDARRNCISNIRPPEGLGYEAAADTLLYLTEESIRRRLSGVDLKNEMAAALPEGSGF
jgi:ethanolamine ammonia-lyase small subunit